MTRSTAIRQRKLNTKTGLAVISEDQLEGVDDDTQRNVPKIDTGVEQAEQNVSLFSSSAHSRSFRVVMQPFDLFFRFLPTSRSQPDHVT